MKPRTFVAWSFFGGLQHDTLNMTPYFQIYGDLGSTELSSRQPGKACPDECSDEEEAPAPPPQPAEVAPRCGAI